MCEYKIRSRQNRACSFCRRRCLSSLEALRLLIPELQGRFPIRVELKSLTQEDFIRILTEPRIVIIQYKELLATEGVLLEFSEEAIEELAKIACQVNEQAENIGARRLHTIMEQLLEKVSFEAPEMQGEKSALLLNISKNVFMTYYKTKI